MFFLQMRFLRDESNGEVHLRHSHPEDTCFHRILKLLQISLQPRLEPGQVWRVSSRSSKRGFIQAWFSVNISQVSTSRAFVKEQLLGWQDRGTAARNEF